MNILKKLIVYTAIFVIALFVGIETKYYINYHGNIELRLDGPRPERVCVLELYGVCIAREGFGSIGNFVGLGKYKWHFIALALLIGYILLRVIESLKLKNLEQKTRNEG